MTTNWYTIDPQDENVALIPLSNTPGKFAKVDMALIEEIGRHGIKWNVDGGGYAQTYSKILGKSVHLHRLVSYLNYAGFWTTPRCHADHINRDRLDNTAGNMRLGAHGHNRDYTSGTSKFPGVHYDSRTKRWVAEVMVDGKVVRLDNFKDETYAARRYRDAVLKLDPLVKHESWKELDSEELIVLRIGRNGL